MVRQLLRELGLELPVLAAPMSGGPTTPAMVTAARDAGSFGFLAGGYKPVSVLAAQIRTVRDSCSLFGVNLFAPNPLPVDTDRYRSYAAAINPEAERYGIDLTSSAAQEDDDGWSDKIDLLLRDPVPVVSFTFGIPERPAIDSLRRVGSLIVQTVTSATEAVAAMEAGVDLLAVQGHEAGGHFATLTPRNPPPAVPLTDLVSSVRAATSLPIIAAGGLGPPGSIKGVLSAGAEAVMVGTFLLLTIESGASATYKAALDDLRATPTAVTVAFTGRPARGIRNRFMSEYEALAPIGYPAIHHLTSPLRQAAAASGDPDVLNLWAGTGHALAREQTVRAALTGLAEEL